MLETALTAFTTFFAVIGPIDTAVLLASLTPNMMPAERRAIAVKAGNDVLLEKQVEATPRDLRVLEHGVTAILHPQRSEGLRAMA